MDSTVDAKSKSDDAMARIRNANKLYHLRLRPRCADGRLDIRQKVNRSFEKNAVVTDFYDPEDPTRAGD